MHARSLVDRLEWVSTEFIRSSLNAMLCLFLLHSLLNLIKLSPLCRNPLLRYSVNHIKTSQTLLKCYEVSHARVQLHDGVWLVDDNVLMHDTFMVKLAVCNTDNYNVAEPRSMPDCFNLHSFCKSVCLVSQDSSCSCGIPQCIHMMAVRIAACC